MAFVSPVGFKVIWSLHACSRHGQSSNMIWLEALLLFAKGEVVTRK